MEQLHVVLGIDIGGTNTAFGLVDVRGNIYLQGSLPTKANNSFDDFFGRLKHRIELELEQSTYQFDIMAIGIGAPNANFYTGAIDNPPNLNWEQVNLVQIFKQAYALPVVITNDANAAALGEQKFGAASDMQNFVEITLGTGLGSGIVVDGKLVLGSDGHAGELGHVTVEPGGRLCACGRKGCLETYVSAEGIKRTVAELLKRGAHNSSLSQIPPVQLNGEQITRAAEQGDTLALEAFQKTAEILGIALANVVAYLSPQAIILFGGLAQAGAILFNPLREIFEKNLLRNYVGHVLILASGLKSGQAAILGAAALAWKELSLRENPVLETSDS